MTYPSIYPTGATIYDPARCWSGYTLFQAREVGAMLIDMNGTEVKLWKGLHGLPNKLLPGGFVMGHTGERNNAHGLQDYVDVVQVDWDGNVVWRFNRYAFIEDPGETAQWMARAHHDFQRQGNPVGYYVPGMDPLTDQGNTIIEDHLAVYARRSRLPDAGRCQPILQPLYQLGTAPAQRQFIDHRRIGRPDHRSHGGSRYRLGIYQSLLGDADEHQHDLPCLSRSL